MIDVAWSMTVIDIERTLREAIDKIFRDKATDNAHKVKLANGLIMLGKLFEKYGDKTGQGILDMKD